MNRITLAVTTAGAAIGSIFGWLYPAALIGRRLDGTPHSLVENITACLIGGALLAIPIFIIGVIITLVFRLFSNRSQA